MDYKLIFFVLGTAFGSFINVLAKRYDPDKPIFSSAIRGRSHCPECRHAINWYDLIPLLSFLFLLGKCRNCRKAISLQYPIVELCSGLIFAFIPYAIAHSYSLNLRIFSSTELMPYYILDFVFILASLTLIFISAVDFRLKIIPDGSNLLIVFLGASVIFTKNYFNLWQGNFGDVSSSFLGHYAFIFGLRHNLFVNHISAALIGLIFFGLIIFLSRGRAMGMGDLKLAGALGLLLGWPDIGLMIILSFILGAAWGIILIVKGGKGLKSALPFGPFITLGAFLTIFFGKTIMDVYFNLFP